MRFRMVLNDILRKEVITLTKKSISKSVRLTQEVFDYIDSSPGNGFNEKFENIILEAKRGESDRKEELARLDERIKRQRENESLLFKKYNYLETSFRDFVHIQHQIENLRKDFDKVVDTEKQIKGD